MSKNTHMMHFEDAILFGPSVFNKTMDVVGVLFEDLKGFTPEKDINVSVKIDGAPAMFAWSSFPGLEDYGVTTKSLFATKKQRIYYSEKDADLFSPDLADKLDIMVSILPELNIPAGEIWQGDFLFAPDTLKYLTLEVTGEQVVGFKPNTLFYVVDRDTEMGRKIQNSRIGIVWHTKYTGSSLLEAEASFNISADELTVPEDTFMIDPYIPSLVGKIKLTEEETLDVDTILANVITRSSVLLRDPMYVDFVEKEMKDFIPLTFMVYQNYLIRNNREWKVGDALIKDFTDWAIDRLENSYEKKIQKLKTEKGKIRAKEKLEVAKQNISDTIKNKYPEVLKTISEIINDLTLVKSILIEKLNYLDFLEDSGTFVEYNTGELQPTNQEGFAISDANGFVVKLVDRSEFSFLNFSDELKKGWQ
jgi:hypothetical protein